MMPIIITANNCDYFTFFTHITSATYTFLLKNDRNHHSISDALNHSNGNNKARQRNCVTVIIVNNVNAS